MNKDEYAILLLFNAEHPVLSPQDIALLTGKSIDNIGSVVAFLVKEGYLIKSIGYGQDNDPTVALDSKFLLTYVGKRAMQEYHETSRKQFWLEFRAWATLSIAVAAFILSVIALLLQ